MANLEFKWLLIEGIASVANRQRRKVGAVQEEIGYALSVTADTVQYWKRGHVPDMDRLEFLVAYCQQYGRVDDAWARSFLTQASHPDPDEVMSRVFRSEPRRGSDWETPQVHHNLPARRSRFFGRETEMARALEWISMTGEPLAAIEGIGGIGKTSLAIEVGHRLLLGQQAGIAKPFQAVIWVSVRYHIDFDSPFNYVLDTIARELHYSHLVELPLKHKVYEVEKLLRSRSTLVIVDNFETVEDEELNRFLEQTPEPSKAIITTRYKKPVDAWEIHLDGLKTDETLTLIRHHSHRIGLNTIAEADDDTLKRLALATRSNPKAVKLSLGLIRQGGLAFHTVVDELYQASQIVEEIFDYIFAEAWKLLENSARRVLRAMPLFVFSASREALSAVSETKGDDFNQAIEQLVGMSLLEASETLDLGQQRYRVHPLTRAFVKRKLGVDKLLNRVPGNMSIAEVPLPEFLNLRSKFCAFFAEWCREKAGGDYWGIVSWKTEIFEELYQEMSNLLVSLDWAYKSQDWPAVLTLAKTIVHPIHHQGRVDKRIKCSEYGITAAEELGEVEDQIWFTIDGLGLVHHQSGHHKNATECVSRGIRLAKEYNLHNAIALGEVLLSYEALRTDNLDEAQKHVDEALRHADGSYLKYRAYRAAGHIARHQKNCELAEKYYLQGAEFLKGTEYRSTSDLYLGLTNLGLERFEKAGDYFRKTLETHRKYGDQRIVARAKLGMAITYTTKADKFFQKASDFVSEASEVFSQMGLQRELRQTEGLKERLSKYK